MLQVRGRDVGFQTTKEGEFWRILLPGIYTMEVFAEGFAPREVQFAIVEQNPTMLNVTLYPVRFYKRTYMYHACHKIITSGISSYDIFAHFWSGLTLSGCIWSPFWVAGCVTKST